MIEYAWGRFRKLLFPFPLQVRTDLVVYDPVAKHLYFLDGYNYSFLIDRVEEDRIVIAMKGPYGSKAPILTTYGTVRTEDGRIVFVPDSEEP